MYRIILVSILLLLFLFGSLLAGCGKSEVTFDELFAKPEKYNGKIIVLEGFYFHGFESILFCEDLKDSGYGDGHISPTGHYLWIEGGIPRDIYDLLYQQQMMGPLEIYGKLRIEGTFAYGGGYGHLGSYSHQITPSLVEILPWTPPSIIGK